MRLVAVGVLAGLTGTVAMDLGNLLFSRLGVISRVDVGMIGRMARGWTRGRFRYGHPSEMDETPGERSVGVLTHYAIGVGLAVPFVVGWDLFVGGPAPPGSAALYGVATTVASWFFVYPSMGFGVLGMRSPEGLKAPLSSLANHLFYGLGLAVGLTLA